jgi:DNA-directed RNA polymerase subunit omega
MMLHPSYTDLMNVVNADVEDGEAPVVASRYSIVMATAKRARQIIGGAPALVETKSGRFSKKPLSIAVEELEKGRIRIVADDSDDLPLV